MTLRYAKLASPAIRAAYQDAMDKIRARQPLPIVAIGSGPVIPDRAEWLHPEMLNTRLAHGSCSPHPPAAPRPPAKICGPCQHSAPPPPAPPLSPRPPPPH